MHNLRKMVEDEALAIENSKGIKLKGVEFDLKYFSNYKAPPVIEKEWAVERVITGKETSGQLSKRLKFKYDTLRKWVERHRGNPNRVTSQSGGRPTKLAAVTHRKTKVVALTYKVYLNLYIYFIFKPMII